MLVQPEGFPNHPANAIALDRATRQLRCDGHAETRVPLIIEACSHAEEPVPHAPAARVNSIELRLPPQAALRGKSESPGRVAARTHRVRSTPRRSNIWAGEDFFFKE
jgi:hypothetical protein